MQKVTDGADVLRILLYPYLTTEHCSSCHFEVALGSALGSLCLGHRQQQLSSKGTASSLCLQTGMWPRLITICVCRLH